ncbi:MAG: hypothetical protein LAT58_06925 [Opitutales bacterium]|nr:hypothetical protein [Opitutales bacterium]
MKWKPQYYGRCTKSIRNSSHLYPDMKWQLFYTSARRGLESGSYGFTVVARDREFSGRLQRHLVRLSHFDQRLRNPEGLASFRIFETNDETYYILSRIRKSGSDYSGRGNFLAQHLILDKAETFGLPNPAVILKEWAGWRENWNSPARYLEESDYPDWPEAKPDRKAWDKIAGEADYAAHWALISERESPVAMKLPMADSFTQSLALFADSGAVLKDDAWKKPFTTCLQIKDKPEDFEWLSLVPKVSPEKTISFPETHFFDFTEEPPKLPESQGKKLRMEKQHDGARQLRGDYFRRAPKPGEVRVKEKKKKGPRRSTANSSAANANKLRLYVAGGLAALIALGAFIFILIHLLSSPPPPTPVAQNEERLFPSSPLDESDPSEDDTIPSLSPEEDEALDTDPQEPIEEEVTPLWEIHRADLLEVLEREESIRTPFSLSSTEALVSYQGFLSAEPPSEKIREVQDRLPWHRQNYFLFLDRADQLQSHEGVANFSDWKDDLYELIEESINWVAPQVSNAGSWVLQEQPEGSARKTFSFEGGDPDQSIPQDDLILYSAEEAEDRELFFPEDLAQILKDEKKLYLELHFQDETRRPVGLYLFLHEDATPPLGAPQNHVKFEAESSQLSLRQWPEDLLKAALTENQAPQTFGLKGHSPDHFADDQISAWIEMALEHNVLLGTSNENSESPTFPLLPSTSEEFPLRWPDHASLADGKNLNELEEELADLLSSKAKLQTLLSFSQAEFNLRPLQNRWGRYTRGEGWHGERTEKQLLIVAQHYDEIKPLILGNAPLWQKGSPDLSELKSDLPQNPDHEGLNQTDWVQEIFAHFILLSAWQLEDDQLLAFEDEQESTEEAAEHFEENGEPEERTEGNGNGTGSGNQETESAEETNQETSEPSPNNEENAVEETENLEEEDEKPEESPLRKRLNQTTGTYNTALQNAREAWQEELQNHLNQLNDTLAETRKAYLATFLEKQFTERLPFSPWTLTHQKRPLVRFE